MNKNIFKAHLEELLNQLLDKSFYNDKKRKTRLLLGLETQIEMCNLITKRFNKDYSNERNFFAQIEEFILLDEFVQAIKYIEMELEKISTISVSTIEEYI